MPKFETNNPEEPTKLDRLVEGILADCNFIRPPKVPLEKKKK